MNDVPHPGDHERIAELSAVASQSDRQEGARTIDLLMTWIERRGVSYGREDSFKLSRGRILADRVLVGIDMKDVTVSWLFEVATGLGMPASCRSQLEPHLSKANAVLFGIEDRTDGSVRKVYLEFWDQVRDDVRRSGPEAPRLLHLGVKWDTRRPGRSELAHYMCHPQLGLREVCRRMGSVYGPAVAPAALEEALAIVRLGAMRRPHSSMLYLEVSEEGNPRSSFDVNLYKSGLTVSDVATPLEHAARNFGVPEESLLAETRRLGPCPLGHLAGGIDRHGNEFLSVYAEVRAI